MQISRSGPLGLRNEKSFEFYTVSGTKPVEKRMGRLCGVKRDKICREEDGRLYMEVRGTRSVEQRMGR